MFDRRSPPEHVALELAALRIEHDLQANLISRLADALYMTPGEREMLTALRAEHAEVAAWAAGVAASFPPPAEGPRTERGRPASSGARGFPT